MQQRRWVSYIYRYRNHDKCEIAGFVKIQRITYKTRDEVRIRIGLKMYKGYPCECTAYLIRNGEATPFTKIQFAAHERDTLLSSVELPWKDPLSEGVGFPEYDGVYILCGDGEELAGVWNEEVFPTGDVVTEIPTIQLEASAAEETKQERKSSQERKPSPERKLESERKPSLERKSEPETKPETAPVSCQELLRTYPKLPLFAGSQILDGVKIVPQDIGKLPVANWKLGVNSFLSHGYYRYQYLMLGKVRLNQRECYVIGVPGVFTNKEKYLANMFGFRIFVPVKKTKINTGNFGYWIYEIEHPDAISAGNTALNLHSVP